MPVNVFVRRLMMNVKLQDLAMDQTEVVFTHFYVLYHGDARGLTCNENLYDMFYIHTESHRNDAFGVLSIVFLWRS